MFTSAKSAKGNTGVSDTSQEFADLQVLIMDEGNCTNCVGCSYCTNCKDCSYCTYCEDCTNCIDCHDCHDCVNCHDCDYCHDYVNCIGCIDCAYCVNCTNCTNCTNCIGCIGCHDCIDCDYCTNCINCTNCIGCVNGKKSNRSVPIMPILKHRQSRRVAIVNVMILARTHGTKVAAYHCYRQGISIEAALYLLARRKLPAR